MQGLDAPGDALMEADRGAVDLEASRTSSPEAEKDVKDRFKSDAFYTGQHSDSLHPGGRGTDQPVCDGTQAEAAPSSANAADSAVCAKESGSPQEKPSSSDDVQTATKRAVVSATSWIDAQGAGQAQGLQVQPHTNPGLANPTEVVQTAEDVRHLPESYAVQDLDEPLADHQLDRTALQLSSINHLVSSKRSNLLYLDHSTVLTSAGNTVIFYRPNDGSMKFLPGLDGGGIATIALHPTESLFLVAEQCKTRCPNVYIYHYVENGAIELYRILRNGTERSYSAASFNRDGSLLVMVGAAPDYMMTLWDWRNEDVILRSKAFSQEIYNVEFSRYVHGHLNTSGTGHIRFWKMASTFTGLKLVGNLGKFGKFDLSDVCAFVELPDGKVLSGSETGEMLLWDGGLIKVVLKRRGHATCHDGNIEVLQHVLDRNLIYSAGQDGYIRMWDATKVCSHAIELMLAPPTAPTAYCHLHLGHTQRSEQSFLYLLASSWQWMWQLAPC
jgi:hypothetical protein